MNVLVSGAVEIGWGQPSPAGARRGPEASSLELRCCRGNAGQISDEPKEVGTAVGTAELVLLILVAAILWDAARGRTGDWAHPSRWFKSS